MRGLTVVLGILAAVLFIPPQLWAKTFYLKNGEEIEYQSYRQQEGRVIVLINRDTEVDFALDEVDLMRTGKDARAAEARKKAREHRHKKGKGAPKAAKPGPAKADSPKAGEQKPAPAANPAPGARKAPANTRPGTAALRNELAAVYAGFHKATQGGDFNELMKYGTAKNRKQMQEMLAKVPDEQREQVTELLKAMTARSYAVTGCTSSPDGRSAILTLKGKIDFMGKDADSDGTIDFVREEGEWRIDKVAWSAKG